MPSNSRLPSPFAPTATVTATGWTHRVQQARRLADLHVGGVEPKIWPVTLDGAGEEVLHPAIDLGAEATDLALGDALHAHGPDQGIHRTGGDALDVGFLDDGGQGLLGGAPVERIRSTQEGREVAATAQLGG